MNWCKSCAWCAASWVWTETEFTSNCTGLALNLHRSNTAWKLHWLWFDNGLTSDWPRISTGFISIWRACDEDWRPNYFFIIEIVLALYWHQIDNGLAEYWHSIGLVLIEDWHSIDAQVMRFGSLLALDWPHIDNRLAQEWHWIDIKLTIDWHLIAQ